MKGLIRIITSFCFTMLIFQFALFALSYTPNKLTKLYYHQGALHDQVVCCFDKEPICNFMPQADTQDNLHARQKAVFFLPMTSLANAEAKQMMQKVNGTKRNHYSIQIAEVTKPVKGVKIQISYDPDKITCDYASCDTITIQKGLVFSFHNKQMLNTIRDKTNFVLQYAANNSQMNRPLVMLDFGHGGSDNGKVGIAQVKEKDINMHIGTKLASLLKKKGFYVLLTRKSDIFVPLDQRTSLANKTGAQLFVSLHSNASPSEKTSGIETYWTPRTLLKQIKWIGEPNTMLNTIAQKHDEESKLLAQSIQDKVLQMVSAYHTVNDRKVKESVAQVLLTEMPSALIEMGFLSNKQETQYLSDPAYQLILAKGICAGIEAYCEHIKIV